MSENNKMTSQQFKMKLKSPKTFYHFGELWGRHICFGSSCQAWEFKGQEAQHLGALSFWNGRGQCREECFLACNSYYRSKNEFIVAYEMRWKEFFPPLRFDYRTDGVTCWITSKAAPIVGETDLSNGLQRPFSGSNSLISFRRNCCEEIVESIGKLFVWEVVGMETFTDMFSERCVLFVNKRERSFS